MATRQETLFRRGAIKPHEEGSDYNYHHKGDLENAWRASTLRLSGWSSHPGYPPAAARSHDPDRIRTATSSIEENPDVRDPLTDSENKRLCLPRGLPRAVQFTQSAYKMS